MSETGFFPSGASMLRTVVEERAVGLLWGQRSICVGAVAPLNSAGTIRHTKGLLRPFDRFRVTGKMFEAVIFGSRLEAEAALAITREKHEPVRGSLPEDIGSLPAGTEYSANDPEAMLWTIAVMFDSAQCLYELLVARLGDAEREALWRDMVHFGELFGMPRDVAPKSYLDFRAYYRRRLNGRDLQLTREAEYLGHAAAFRIPFGHYGFLIRPIHNVIMRGTLPERVRNLYGLRYTPLDALGFRVAAALVRFGRRLAPSSLVRGPSAPWFDWVAGNELWCIQHGRPTPQLKITPT
jgi:uncharacterized protein (DUF2236 family)